MIKEDIQRQGDKETMKERCKKEGRRIEKKNEKIERRRRKKGGKEEEERKENKKTEEDKNV